MTDDWDPDSFVGAIHLLNNRRQLLIWEAEQLGQFPERVVGPRRLANLEAQRMLSRAVEHLWTRARRSHR